MKRETTDTNTTPHRETLSLRELNLRIKESIEEAFPDTFWIHAETSDVNTNTANGHCYLEFIEKDPKNGKTVARARGIIWSNIFNLLKIYFEQATGQAFTNGLKVLVEVKVTFHEQFGYSLSVLDIDPSYTIGDMALRRQEILRQLKEEGILDLNKELPFPTLPQRIAIISSPTAAGFGDFARQILDNPRGYAFYQMLFPATMQGEKTEESIVHELDVIYKYRRFFDVVVIIRGGGATSDLNSFDTYRLAASCAQFPLPVITGIGHERDDTVLDAVAYQRMKTPTAVAEFLIGCMDQASEKVESLTHDMTLLATRLLSEKKEQLQSTIFHLPLYVSSAIERQRNRLTELFTRLTTNGQALLDQQKHYLDKAEQYIQLVEPSNVLRRGYTLTLRDGKIVKSAQELKTAEHIVTRFMDGESISTVNEVKNNDMKENHQNQ